MNTHRLAFLTVQLDVIFDVVGTPPWRDIETVPSEAWRSYLKRLPGRVRGPYPCCLGSTAKLVKTRRGTGREGVPFGYLPVCSGWAQAF